MLTPARSRAKLRRRAPRPLKRLSARLGRRRVRWLVRADRAEEAFERPPFDWASCG